MDLFCFFQGVSLSSNLNLLDKPFTYYIGLGTIPCSHLRCFPHFHTTLLGVEKAPEGTAWHSDCMSTIVRSDSNVSVSLKTMATTHATTHTLWCCHRATKLTSSISATPYAQSDLFSLKLMSHESIAKRSIFICCASMCEPLWSDNSKLSTKSDWWDFQHSIWQVHFVNIACIFVWPFKEIAERRLYSPYVQYLFNIDHRIIEVLWGTQFWPIPTDSHHPHSGAKGTYKLIPLSCGEWTGAASSQASGIIMPMKNQQLFETATVPVNLQH